jgi:hypothetical protein
LWRARLLSARGGLRLGIRDISPKGEKDCKLRSIAKIKDDLVPEYSGEIPRSIPKNNYGMRMVRVTFLMFTLNVLVNPAPALLPPVVTPGLFNEPPAVKVLKPVVELESSVL